jgi:D-alanine-D-alanine ligase-like ATP-grasp enzyme
MDKGMSKTIFRQNGIQVHNGFTIFSGKYDLQQVMSRIEEEIDTPPVVKPNDQGSTSGLTICKRAEEIKKHWIFPSLFLIPRFLRHSYPAGNLQSGYWTNTTSGAGNKAQARTLRL